MQNFLTHINSLTSNQLRQELKELYSSYETVRIYYDLKWKGNTVDKAVLEKYKTQITTALYSDKRMSGGFDYEEVAHILKTLNSDVTIQYYIQASRRSRDAGENINRIKLSTTCWCQNSA